MLLELKSKQKGGENVLVELLYILEKGKVLKLKKTLYGLCQALCTFRNYLVEKLEAFVMYQSKLNPPLFIGKRSYAFHMLMIPYFSPMMSLISMTWLSSYANLLFKSSTMILQDFLV